MEEGKGSRRWLPILGWVVAGILLLLFLASQYDISIQKRPPKGSEQPAIAEKVTEPRPSASVQAKPTQVRYPTPRELSTQELFQMASPSVVLIEVFDDEGHRRGLGSGFIASSEGAIVTNYHVIRGAVRAVAHFADGSSAPILGIVGYDRDRDVAVLSAGGAIPPALKLGNSDTSRVGEKVVSIGSPLGFQNTISEGIVSGLRLGLIQMSAPISPGSSGGPVLSSRGEVVGVAVASVIQGQNLNFAVPINWAKNYLRGASRSLTEIAAENTVVERILDGTVSIPAGQASSWEIKVNTNMMSDPEIHGSFEARGGLTQKVRVRLLFGQRVLFDSDRTTQGEIHQPLSEDGVYTLVIDNTESMMFSRQVTGHISLRFVR